MYQWEQASCFTLSQYRILIIFRKFDIIRQNKVNFWQRDLINLRWKATHLEVTQFCHKFCHMFRNNLSMFRKFYMKIIQIYNLLCYSEEDTLWMLSFLNIIAWKFILYFYIVLLLHSIGIRATGSSSLLWESLYNRKI